MRLSATLISETLDLGSEKAWYDKPSVHLLLLKSLHPNVCIMINNQYIPSIVWWWPALPTCSACWKPN